MTTVYIPRLIETAEQAEALPVGTVAIESGEQGQAVGASIRVRGGWHCTGETEAYGGMWLVPHDRMIGDTALVPIGVDEVLAEKRGPRSWNMKGSGPRPFGAYVFDMEEA